MTTSSDKCNAKTQSSASTTPKSSRQSSRRTSRSSNETQQQALARGDEELTQHLINLMAQNINPWRRDWTTYQNKGAHRNLVTGHAYRGANPAVLEMWTALRCFSTPLWLGVGQAKPHGWFPRKGSKGCAIIQPVLVKYNKKGDDGKELRDENGRPIKVGYTKFRYQKIFNVADLQGATENHMPSSRTRSRSRWMPSSLRVSTNA